MNQIFFRETMCTFLLNAHATKKEKNHLSRLRENLPTNQPSTNYRSYSIEPGDSVEGPNQGRNSSSGFLGGWEN